VSDSSGKRGSKAEQGADDAKWLHASKVKGAAAVLQRFWTGLRIGAFVAQTGSGRCKNSDMFSGRLRI
jgi:hypothetical protein